MEAQTRAGGGSPCNFNTYPYIYNLILPQEGNEGSLQTYVEDIEILSGGFSISERNEAKGLWGVGVRVHDACSWLWLLVGEGSPLVWSFLIW